MIIIIIVGVVSIIIGLVIGNKIGHWERNDQVKYLHDIIDRLHSRI